MAQIYYVDSVLGSNFNDGTSPVTALRTLEAVEQKQLRPGDTVLLARGSTFQEQLDIRYSGSASAPITFGAYGVGDDPVLTGGSKGILGSKTHYITVEDLTITGISTQAIYAGGASNWIVDNVTVFAAPGTSDQAIFAGEASNWTIDALTVVSTAGTTTGGISFQNSSDITIRNSTIDGVTSDGIWIDNVTGLTIEGNTIGTVQGANSDNIQIVNSSQVIVRDNVLDLSGETNSTKGNLVVNKSMDVLIDGNTLIGGGYGASVNSDHVVITDNEIYGQSGYTWTYGIGLGERWDVSDYVIADNSIHDVRFGVAITGIGTTEVFRENVEVYGNVFENTEGAALKVDRPASGSFYDNYVHVGSPSTRISTAVSEAGTFVIGENYTFSNDPAANPDADALAELETFATGNLLSNDVSLVDADLTVTQVAGVEVGSGVSVAGEFGTLVVSSDGSYVYSLDADKLAGVGSSVTETFPYAVTDGQSEGISELAIAIEPRPNTAPVTAIDFATPVNLPSSGNVLANDHDADGDVLHVSAVGDAEVPPGGLSIEGQHGVLTVQQDGSYTYTLSGQKVSSLTADTIETFTYLASDGRSETQGLLAFTIRAPTSVPALKPTAVNDSMHVDVGAGLPAYGNVLANDYDLNGDTIYLRTMGSAKVADREVTVTGLYGELGFRRNGDYRYEIDETRTEGLEGVVRESFYYKISDGALLDSGALSFAIDLRPPIPVETDPFGLA
jgi:polysaccharidase protein